MKSLFVHFIASIAIYCSSICSAGVFISPNVEVVGDELIDRALNDGTNGALFVVDDPFTITGFVTQWSFFDNDGVGRTITPIIVEPVGADHIIRGIGTSRVSDGSGIQSFNFGVVEGNIVIRPGFLIGFKDGTQFLDNNGVADFDSSPDDSITTYFGSGWSNRFNAGTNIGVGQLFLERDYSIQFTGVKPIVPEPTTAVYLFGGLSLIGICRGRLQREWRATRRA